MERFDQIVIGVGGMGSAACDQLALRGQRVLGLEQFELGHRRGSSHGQTRIIRKAYFEHPDYVPLLHRAYELWADLERRAGRTLFERTGLLLAGRPEGVVIRGVRRSAAEHGLAIRDVGAAERAERFGQFALGPELEVLFEKDAGFLYVEDCVRTCAEQARARGAVIRDCEPAIEWRVGRDGVEVRTERGTYAAATLLVCGGPWAGRLLPALRAELEVRRKVQLWLACDDPRYAQAAGSPAFCFDLAEGFFYGFPMLEPGLIKVAEHTGREVVDDPAAVDQELRLSDEMRVQQFVVRYLPGVRPVVRAHAVCLYTMSPDENFIIDRHPEHANVLVAAGFSGHGFKFAPLVGSVLADWALGRRTREPVDFLAWKHRER
jgi:sarcosine oxidase